MHSAPYVRTHPPGPVSLALPAFPGAPRANARSWPIRARIDLNFSKVKQNGGVSPKYVQKASRTPYFQNELQKSPLGILRKPFSLAFSHKELMAPYCRYSGFNVKMTKCRPVVHPMCTRSVRSDTPTCARSKLPLCTRSSSDLGAVFSTTPVLDVS